VPQGQGNFFGLEKKSLGLASLEIRGEAGLLRTCSAGGVATEIALKLRAKQTLAKSSGRRGNQAEVCSLMIGRVRKRPMTR